MPTSARWPTGSGYRDGTTRTRGPHGLHLAAAYQRAGRLGDAIHHYEQALADSERMLGPGDLETLTARSSLAAAHFAAGRLAGGDPAAAADAGRQRALSRPGSPADRAVRDNLEAATRKLKRADPAKAGSGAHGLEIA